MKISDFGLQISDFGYRSLQAAICPFYWASRPASGCGPAARRPFQIVGLLISLIYLSISSSLALAAPQESDPPAQPASEQNLATVQQQLSEQVTRLESLLLRSSDIEALDNPTRAALLQQAVGLSKQAQLAETLLKASQNLSANQLSEAIESQKLSRDTLKRLLELLQSENREQRVREQRDQVRRWIEETDRLLRMQSSLRGRTEGGLDAKQASEDQSKLSDKAQSIAGDLGELLDENAPAESKSESPNDPASESNEDQNNEGEPSKSSGESSDSQPAQEQSSQGNSPENQPSSNPSQQDQSSQGQPSGEQQSEGQQSDAQQSQNQQSQNQQSQGQQSDGQQSSDGSASEQPTSQQPQSPMERAQQRIEQAQQNMQEAMENLEQAKREGAIEKQREAEQNLKEAIEQLEEILNQLREEEIKRSLETLESRLKRMLEMQSKVLEETTRLHEIGGDKPDRQVLSRASQVAKDQQKVGTEGERALLLLKEEGSSAAFPEALEQVNRDIASSANRLESGDLSKITLVIQTDIVQSLEEMVEAIAKVRKENEEKKQKQQQQGGSPMDPGMQPLINQLAELRLIRTLQLRINKRTDTLSTMLDDPNDPVGQARENDLLGELKELGKRQENIEQVTRNIAQGP